MVSEAGRVDKKAPQDNDSPSVRERLLRRAGVPLVAALTAVALVACSNTGAKEQPQPEPTSISSEAPGQPTGPDEDPSDTPNDPDPTETSGNGNFVGIPSGLTVNYDHFANWDNMRSRHGDGTGDSLEDDPHGQLREPGEGKLATCYDFFRTNGLVIDVHQGSGRELDSNGEGLHRNPEEFITSMLDRRNMVLALAADDTDPRNLDVSYKVTECLTTPEDSVYRASRERANLLGQIEGIRDGSIQLSDATYSLSSIENTNSLQSGQPGYSFNLTNGNGEEFTATSGFSVSKGDGRFRFLTLRDVDGNVIEIGNEDRYED